MFENQGPPIQETSSDHRSLIDAGTGLTITPDPKPFNFYINVISGVEYYKCYIGGGTKYGIVVGYQKGSNIPIVRFTKKPIQILENC